MNKNALVAALALVVVSGWLVGARAQEPSPPGEGPDPDPAFSINRLRKNDRFSVDYVVG